MGTTDLPPWPWLISCPFFWTVNHWLGLLRKELGRNELLSLDVSVLHTDTVP